MNYMLSEQAFHSVPAATCCVKFVLQNAAKHDRSPAVTAWKLDGAPQGPTPEDMKAQIILHE